MPVELKMNKQEAIGESILIEVFQNGFFYVNEVDEMS